MDLYGSPELPLCMAHLSLQIFKKMEDAKWSKQWYY